MPPGEGAKESVRSRGGVYGNDLKTVTTGPKGNAEQSSSGSANMNGRSNTACGSGVLRKAPLRITADDTEKNDSKIKGRPSTSTRESLTAMTRGERGDSVEGVKGNVGTSILMSSSMLLAKTMCGRGKNRLDSTNPLVDSPGTCRVKRKTSFRRIHEVNNSNSVETGCGPVSRERVEDGHSNGAMADAGGVRSQHAARNAWESPNEVRKNRGASNTDTPGASAFMYSPLVCPVPFNDVDEPSIRDGPSNSEGIDGNVFTKASDPSASAMDTDGKKGDLRQSDSREMSTFALPIRQSSFACDPVSKRLSSSVRSSATVDNADKVDCPRSQPILRSASSSFRVPRLGVSPRGLNNAEHGGRCRDTTNERHHERLDGNQVMPDHGSGSVFHESFEISNTSKTVCTTKDQGPLSSSAHPTCFYPIYWNACGAREGSDVPVGNNSFVPLSSRILVGNSASREHCLPSNTQVSPRASHGRRESAEWWFKEPTVFCLSANLILLLERQESMKQNLEQGIGGTVPPGFGPNRGTTHAGSFCMDNSDDALADVGFICSQISYAVLDIKTVLLNPYFVRWSNREVRRLVSDVATAWDTHGRKADEFARAAYALLGAVSSECVGSITYTNLYYVWEAVGASTCAWVTVAVLCFATLGCIIALFASGAVFTSVHIAIASGGMALNLLAIGITLVLQSYNSLSTSVWKFCHKEMMKQVDAVQEHLCDDDMVVESEAVGAGEGGDGVMPNLMVYNSSRTRHRGGARQSYPPNQAEGLRDDGCVECSQQFSRAIHSQRCLVEGSSETGGISRREPPPSNTRAPVTISGASSNFGRGDEHVSPRGDYTQQRRLDRHGSEGGWSQLTGNCWDDGFVGNNPFSGRALQLGSSNRLAAGGASGERQGITGDHAKEKDAPVRDHVDYCRYGGERSLRHGAAMEENNWEGEWQGTGFTGTHLSPREGVWAGLRDARKHLFDAPGPAMDSRAVCSASANRKGAPDCSTVSSTNSFQNSLVIGDYEMFSVTALVCCSDHAVTHELFVNLWSRNIYILQRSRLEDIDVVFHSCTDQSKIILIHVPDIDSNELMTALSWLNNERRMVFFFASSGSDIPSAVPEKYQLSLPLTWRTIEQELLASMFTDEMYLKALSNLSGQFKVSRYTLGRRLGGGAFGNVFEVEIEHIGGRCAVKRMYLRGAHGGANGSKRNIQVREIFREVEIMRILDHPNIVHFLFCECDGKCVSIFMEMCAGGSLGDLINHGEIRGADHVISILRELISAVLYLHERNIIHRDLKPENILFHQDHVKVSDFGTAVMKKDNLTNTKGTLAYMAPEVVLGERYGRSCDIWSVGCIAAELLGILHGFNAGRANQRTVHKTHTQASPKKQDAAPPLGLPQLCEKYREMDLDSTLAFECDQPVVADFLGRCFRRDPRKRSGSKELLRHPLLNAQKGSPLWEWLNDVTGRRRALPSAYRGTTVILTSVVAPGGNKTNGGGGDASVHGGDATDGGVCMTCVSHVASMSVASLQSDKEEEESASWDSGDAEQRC